MIYVLYLVVAALVTFMSIKASEYVDMLDKTTLFPVRSSAESFFPQ